MKRIIILTMLITFAFPVIAATITGDPVADGFALTGHSLEKGTYVKGIANYGYYAYGNGFNVQAGSNLEISDGTYSWQAGDAVVAVGGVFTDDQPTGWTLSGNAMNSLLPDTTPYSGPKLQVKFGTEDASWYTSTAAPGSGNGNSSSSNGGGRIQVRTSAYFQTDTPLSGQTEPWTWNGNSGQLLVLDKESHIDWDGGDENLDKRVARMIWVWDDTTNQITSWELLLNVSLLDRVAPEDFTGKLPKIGDMAIMTVQDNDGAYTDALVTTVPEPATMAILGLGGILLRRKRK